jgi:hypothetical protein
MHGKATITLEREPFSGKCRMGRLLQVKDDHLRGGRACSGCPRSFVDADRADSGAMAIPCAGVSRSTVGSLDVHRYARMGVCHHRCKCGFSCLRSRVHGHSDVAVGAGAVKRRAPPRGGYSERTLCQFGIGKPHVDPRRSRVGKIYRRNPIVLVSLERRDSRFAGTLPALGPAGEQGAVQMMVRGGNEPAVRASNRTAPSTIPDHALSYASLQHRSAAQPAVSACRVTRIPTMNLALLQNRYLCATVACKHGGRYVVSITMQAQVGA